MADFSAARSVVTSASLAGFAVASPSESTPKSAVTSLAGFALGGGNLPHRPGGRTGTPAPRRYPAAVSRRMPVCFSMRRKVQPSWPSAITCFCFSSLKTLLTLTEPNPVGTNVLSASSVGRFLGDHQWPVLGDRRGQCQQCAVVFQPEETCWGKGKFGPGIKTYSLYLNIELRLPQLPIASKLNRLFGFHVDASNIGRFKAEAAEKYEGTFAALVDRLCSSRLLHVDETKINLQGKED